jgi:hypothetical protein
MAPWRTRAAQFLDFPVTHAVIDAAMESDDPTIASYLLRHFEEEGADEAEAAAAAAEGRGAAQRSHVHRAAATGDLWVGGEGGGSGAEEEEEEVCVPTIVVVMLRVALSCTNPRAFLCTWQSRMTGNGRTRRCAAARCV